MKDLNIGFAICGSFCTFRKTITALEQLSALGANIIPIMSYNAYSTDTRFGIAKEINEKVEEICQKKIIHTIEDAEPVGPKKLCDVMVIAPCTGNTLGKLALGIIDTPVTMAAKSHLRNGRPLILAVSTNDALGGCAKNIGHLLNYKNVCFVPMYQDDYEHKPLSVVADFEKIPLAIEAALQGRQLQPIYLGSPHQ